MVSVIILVVACCLDSFAAAVSFGIRGIRVPFFSAVAMSFTGTLFLGVSFLLAGFAEMIFAADVLKYLSAGMLVVLALWCITNRNADEKADRDLSGNISAFEALIFGAGLSADSLVTGFCFGINSEYRVVALVMSFVVGVAAVAGGYRIGVHFGRKNNAVCGITAAFILALAAIKLFS